MAFGFLFLFVEQTSRWAKLKEWITGTKEFFIDCRWVLVGIVIASTLIVYVFSPALRWIATAITAAFE